MKEAFPINKQTSRSIESHEEISMKKGVDFVFENNPDLITIGTKENYSSYLETIFPGSPYREIVYHGSDEKFERFDNNSIGKNTDPQFKGHFGQRIFFSTSPTPGYGKHVIAALINPDPNLLEYPTENSYEDPKVENASQVHILGTQEDKARFKTFVESS